jgi:hypothetical protein
VNVSFEGPRAWRGSELEGDSSWCLPVSGQLRTELRRLLDGSVKETPCLDDLAIRVRKELAEGLGFVVVRGLPVESYSEAEARVLYRELSQRIGPILPQTLQGETLYSVRDEGLTLERDYGRAGVRTSKTRSAFDFHTDSPSRLAGQTPIYIGLLVLNTAKAGGETALVNGYAVHNALAAEKPAVLDRLYQPFWVDRRAESPPGEDPILPVPVFSQEKQRLLVRYLRFYITKGQQWKGEPLTSAELDALDILDEVMNRPGMAMKIVPEPGDIQLVNNTFLLHSRTAFEDFPEPEKRRHYLRIWLGRDEVL